MQLLLIKRLGKKRWERITSKRCLGFMKIGQDSILIARESDFNRFAILLGEDTITIEKGQVKVIEFAGNQFG
ncbi:hypothetical protein [Neobacillus cucumis]|uniref:hypothetical protein n=1 Tax=Neobacillus cucumis TaxID=1740721 RepID=UPI002E1FFA97|nr:hypothetical protein [Neobacillus cucumis]